MEKQQNIQTQQAKEKKGLLKKIGTWFASPDGMVSHRQVLLNKNIIVIIKMKISDRNGLEI